MTVRWLGRSLAALALVGMFSSTAAAQRVSFTANLDGGQENPGVTTGAAGTAEITLDVGAGTVIYSADLFNLTTSLVAAHFHVGARGVNGPTVVDVQVAPHSNDIGIRGTAQLSSFTPRPAQGIHSVEDFVQAMLLGNTYINFHTQQFPGGEIRGQVVRKN